MSDKECWKNIPSLICTIFTEKYANVVAIHQKNQGVASARNTGIVYANGKYVGFMDNDDTILPDMINRLYNTAKKNNCDIAITSVYQIKDTGYEALIQYPMEEDIAIETEAFFDMHFTKNCMFSVVIWNKLYRASLVKEHLIPLLRADDCAWTPYILSYADRICYLNGYLYEYDRIIRKGTLMDQWHNRSKAEIFGMHKNTIIFYLKNGNPKRLKYLKMLARKQLLELRRAYAYDEYEKLCKQIDMLF